MDGRTGRWPNSDASIDETGEMEDEALMDSSMYRLLPQFLVATFAIFIGGPVLAAGTALVRTEVHAGRPEVHVLSWDTEGGRRAETNLLRSGKPLGLRVKVDGRWKQGTEFPASPEPAPSKPTIYRLSITPKASLLWNSSAASDSLTMTFSLQGPDASHVEAVEVLFPFDPGVTTVTVLPSQWTDDGSLRLPAVISAPDFGQMLLADRGNRRLKARLEGSRSHKTVDFFVELPALRPGEACVLSLTPVWLPAPKGLVDQAIWEKVRRGWFGALQPSARLELIAEFLAKRDVDGDGMVEATQSGNRGKVAKSSPGSGPRLTRSASIASIWGFRRCSSLSGAAITFSLTVWGFRSEKTARTPGNSSQMACGRY
jgi:hypothetical protein